MPKISKIRFVNFTYNDNRHIYDQTFDFYKGEDTLLNLQNGGGKTVLVQMMLQPIIPKQKLKDRLFKSYFANSKAPVYIMIEWVLDDSTKKVMTGIGIKRVLGKNADDEGESESESLKVVTFISEYKEECGFDIKSIGLLEEERGIVRLIEFDKVVRNLSNAEKEGNSVWVFRWDLPDDKKEYARRLLANKINQLEWKNLMVRINEAEAGLNSFFNDCKTNSALIKKWFIPTIEEQLNKNGNFVENIKELIKNHVEQLVKNEDIVREREIFESFKIKSSELVKNLESHGKLLAGSEKNKSDLGNAYVFVNDRIKALATERDELAANVIQAQVDIRELEYEKLSGEYHEISGNLQQLKVDSDQEDNKIFEFQVVLEGIEYKKNLLMCAKLRDELKNINSKVAKFETELEKENLQQEDIKSIISDIEYSLKEKYSEEITELENTICNIKKLLVEEKSKLARHLEEYEKTKKEVSSCNDVLIDMRGRIAVFDETEDALRTLYPDFDIVKNVNTGEYDIGSIEALRNRLDTEELHIEKSMLDIKAKRVENQRKIELLEKECRELREKYPTLAIEKNRKEAAYRSFESEKDAINFIIRSYQPREDALFEKDKLLISLNTDREKYNKLINDKNLENSILKKQYGLYESGKVFELPEELKQIFDDRNIFVEFGYEWLRSIPDNKSAKLKLVRNNPFLPYSLIVSKDDFKLLQDIEFKALLSSIIPIIEREKLEKAMTVRSRNSIHSVDNVDFLISFDDRILNRNYLKEICDGISIRINKNNEIINNVKEALKNIELGVFRIEGFSYTKEGVDMIVNEIRTITEELEKTALEVEERETGIISIKKDETVDMSWESSLQNEKDKFIRKKGDILAFIGRCESYSSDLKEKRLKDEYLKYLKASLEILENNISKAREGINDKSLKTANITANLEKERLKYQKYADATVGTLIDESIETLESKLTVYTSEISAKIQNLRDIVEDYRHQRDEKQKAIADLHIEEHLYIGKEFSEYEYESLKEENGRIRKIVNDLSVSKNEIQYKIAERNSDLKYMLKSIKERCGYSEPKQREYIRDMDFEKEKSLLKIKLKGLEKETSVIKTQESNLQRVRYVLEEYAAFGIKVTESQYIEGDMNEHASKLVKEYKRLADLVNDSRNILSSMYSEIESVFSVKAEMFKSLFKSILDGDKRYQPVHAINAFNRVYLQIDRKLEQYSIDIRKIDDMEACIIDNTLSYLKNVYDEMNGIDRNSTIDVDGKRCKMLIINLPSKDEMEIISLKEYLRNTILNCVGLCKQGKSIEGLLTNEISTYDLFDRLVGINKVEITLIKIEPNKLKKKTWKQVIEQNSGGEKFVSAFVVFISLLTYMRGENLFGTGMESKVLIMDNPFGPITSEHLLKPLFEISKKYNTQMICLTDMKEHTIFDRFNLIYSLNIEREVGREDEYIEVRTIKKDVVEEEDEVLSASMFRIEDKSRFELVN